MTSPPINYGSRLRLAADDVRSVLLHHPPSALLGKARGRAWELVSSESSAIVMRKALESSSATAPGDLVVKEIEVADLDALHELNRKRRATRKTLRFVADLQRGYRGFVGYRARDAIAYYWWVDRGLATGHRDVQRFEGQLPLGEHEVYGNDLYVLEEHRNGLTANAMLSSVESRLAGMGYVAVWGYVDAENRPARWLYTSRGYEPVSRVTTVTRLGRHRTHASEA